MYNTEGVDAIASITELRANTAELIQHVQESGKGVLIQKNNLPCAVLIDWALYQKIKAELGVTSLSEIGS